ncbi:MAG: hypothetical protein LBG57_02420 [Treponema sp.]|jgi:hypothetical protein|nr:hypothetical protein [Treponema sp.]
MKKSKGPARCVILLAALTVTLAASGVIKPFIRAEAAAFKIETNAGYFSGSTDMQTVEVTRSLSNTLLGITDFILTALAALWIILFAYNGISAVYKYFKSKEKREHEKH